MQIWGACMFDLIIKNGLIIDGSGSEGYVSDIGIMDGSITKISRNLTNARSIIDASGLVVTPGFIDSHSHADKNLLLFPEQREKLEQGITTSVAGQCGGSAAPVKSKNAEEALGSMRGFISAVRATSLGANIVPFVGHGTIRKYVMGDSDRKADSNDLSQMCELLKQSFEAGAGGLSFGLFYAPGCFASTEEAVAMAKVAAQFNRPVSAHIRNESDTLIEAVEEFVEIIRQSKARGILSHHKAVRKRNWGKVEKTLQILRKAVEEGVDIYCDLYPYCASSTVLSQALVPFSWRANGTSELLTRIADPELFANNKAAFLKTNGPNLDWILINSCPGYPQYEGMTIDQIAPIHGKDQFDTAMDLVVLSRDKATACFFTVSEDDLKHVVTWNRTMICTDSGMANVNKRVHPRMIGSFPHAIAHFVKEQNVVSLSEMIRRMTSLPASVYDLKGKGLIKEGFDADLCIFDPDVINNRSDFIQCRQKTEGLNYVLVSGCVVVENGLFNGTKCAQILTK